MADINIKGFDGTDVQKQSFDTFCSIPEADREAECLRRRPDFTVSRESWLDFENNVVPGYTIRWTFDGQHYGFRSKRDTWRQLINACLLAIIRRDNGL